MVRPCRLDEDNEVDEVARTISNGINDINIEEMVPLPLIAKIPDDCMHQILDFLLLNDLHAFGQTCRHIRDSINRYLYREYKANTLEVKMIRGGVMFGPNTGGLFESQISILKMHTNNIDAWTIIAERFKNVNKIIFNKIRVPKTIITPEHGIVLRNILQEAESIEFKRNAFTDEHGQHTLSHCQMLKHLVIGTHIFKRTGQLSHVWMEKMYPTLQSVQFDFGFPDLVNYDEQGEKVQLFFQNNPNIKHLTILTNIEDSLNFICQYGIRLDKLTLRLETNVENVIDLLNHLQTSGQIKRYGLIFQDREILETHAELINKLNKLESVYMKECNYDWAQNYLAFFNKLKSLHIGDISPEGATLLATNAVHLEELNIERGSSEIIDTFVSRAANLRKIAFNEITGSLDTFDWINLIEDRLALTEPRQLYIYVPETTYVSMKTKEMSLTLNLTEANPLFNLGLIKIKRVESLMPYRPC